MSCKRTYITAFVSIILTFGYSQKPIISLSGTVISSNEDVYGIHVINITKAKGTITDQFGKFSINVQESDTLFFSAIQLQNKYLIISQEIVSRGELFVELAVLVNELDEAFIRPYNLSGNIEKDIKGLRISSEITASSLGLPNANVALLSQNERLLFEADNGSFINFMVGPFDGGLSINLHKILNRVSGRTKNLKKMVDLDKNQEKYETIRPLFRDSIVLKELQIPESRLEEFFVYCQADPNFDSLIDTKNAVEIFEFMKLKSQLFRKESQ